MTKVCNSMVEEEDIYVSVDPSEWEFLNAHITDDDREYMTLIRETDHVSVWLIRSRVDSSIGWPLISNRGDGGISFFMYTEWGSPVLRGRRSFLARMKVDKLCEIVENNIDIISDAYVFRRL